MQCGMAWGRVAVSGSDVCVEVWAGSMWGVGVVLGVEGVVAVCWCCAVPDGIVCDACLGSSCLSIVA